MDVIVSQDTRITGSCANSIGNPVGDVGAGGLEVGDLARLAGFSAAAWAVPPDSRCDRRWR